MSVVKRLQEATSKTGLLDILKKAGLSIVLDGNWGETAMQLSGAALSSLARRALAAGEIKDALRANVTPQ
jgi:hypothetical protein